MTAVMQRLQSAIGLVPPRADGKVCHWTFNEQLEQLAKKGNEFFRPLISQHGSLNFEYSVLCTQLTHDYFRNKANQNEITEQLVSALMMAELLTYIYRDYLVVPREVRRLQNEQLIYRQLLATRGFYFDELIPYETESDRITQYVRVNTVATNWPRLFLFRAKRVINACVPLIENIGQYSDIMDTYANPVIVYFSWIFFIPRLVSNLFLLFKHLIPGSSWMDDKEKELGLLSRLNAQLQRRWFELGNDSVWVVANLLSCFVWLGPLAPVGIYITVVLYGYDVILAGLRAAIELYRLKKLQTEYEEIAQKMVKDKASPEAMDEIVRYQQHLQERIRFEQKRLLLSVASTSGLLVAIIICAPALAVSSFIPLLGACLLLLITIVTYCLFKLLEKQRPSSEVSLLLESKKSVFLAPQAMFKPAPKREFDREDAEISFAFSNN